LDVHGLGDNGFGDDGINGFDDNGSGVNMDWVLIWLGL
jgi:hypothetical protein